MKALQLTSLRNASLFLPKLLAPLLVILVAYQASRLTWLVLAPGSASPGSGIAPPPRGLAAVAPTPDYGGAIAERHLFGEAPTATAEAPEEAPETKLNLQLLGLFATADGGGLAIVASGGRNAQVYAVEETLPGGATLKQVLADRVILERDGQLETLRLPEQRPPLIDYAEPAEGGRPLAETAPPAGGDAVAESLARWRERAIRDPSRLGRMLDVEPVEDANGFAGYRITPSSDDPIFAQAGLMPGDIVTEINGVALTSPQQGMLALRRLVDARELSMTVLRDGQPVHIQHSLE